MASEDKIQSEGRKENAAQPLNSAKDDGGPERYPSVRQDDAVERTGRAAEVAGEAPSFDPEGRGPTPRQGAGDSSAEPAAKQDRAGGGDEADER